MTISYEYTTNVTFQPSIGQHNILLRCLPARTAFQQSIDEDFTVSENFWYKEGMDGLGNRLIIGGTGYRHASLCYKSRGVVDASTYCIPDSNPHPMFSICSRQTCFNKDMIGILPSLTGIFLDDCIKIMHSVYRHIVYTPNITNILTTAEEVFLQRQGVCQDYAHLMITLCRAIGFPARYVCGLMMGEGQTHAWVEVNDGNSWYAFDPTNDTAIAYGYIKFAHGRDALDCPVCRGIYSGVANEITNVNVEVREFKQ